MLVEKLSNQSRRVIFTAKRKAERETLGLPTFSHLLSSFSSQKDDFTAKIWQSLDLKIDRTSLYQTAPLEEIVREALNEARQTASETVETSHLLVSTLKLLKVPETILNELRRRLWLGKDEAATRKKSVLETFTKDLSLIDSPLYLREEAIDALKVLLRREKGSLCVSGEKGVGKTSLVRSLGRLMSFPAFGEGHVPQFLYSGLGRLMRVLQFDTNAFLLSDPQNPEDTFGALLSEAVNTPDAILFFDDFSVFFSPSLVFHSIIPTLKGYLESRGLKIIVAYNTSDFTRVFEQDEFFAKFFTTLNLKEPTGADALKILKLHRESLASFHGVGVSENLMPHVVKLSEFVTGSPLPEKALDILDLSCVEARLKRGGVGGAEVLLEDVSAVAGNLSGVPLAAVNSKEKEDLLSLEKLLSQEIIGQEEAIFALARALRKARLGLSEPTRPLGSFLFLGPTGVGKTELVRVLSRHLFGSDSRALRTDSRFIKLDMSEFRERHTVSRLIGAPPGYVGFGQGGELTEKVANNPYCVILVDEMEKAAPEVLNIFLQIMDDGALTDGEGNPVDFRHTIVVFTSNVGAELIKKGRLGFGLGVAGQTLPSHSLRAEKSPSFDEMKGRLLDELKNSFRPEFLNRLDAVIVFRSLNPKDVRQIARLQLQKASARFAEKGVDVLFHTSVVDFIARRGYSGEYGARFLKRTIEEKVVDTLAGFLLSNQLHEGDKVKITATDKELNFKIFPHRRSGRTAEHK